MTIPDEPGAIIERIENGTHTAEDLKALCQLLREGDRQAVSQIGEYNVNVGQGNGFNIGNHFHLEWNEKTFQDLVDAIQRRSSSKSTDSGDTTQDEQEQFEKLEEVDSDFIKLVNSKLEAVERLRESGEISEKQIEEFEILKQKVKSINRLSGQLKDLTRRSERLLQDVISSLETKRQELIRFGEESIGAIRYETQDRENQEQAEALGKQIDMVKRLSRRREDGKKAAIWLDQHRTQFSENVGRRTLDVHSDIKKRASKKQIDNFYFSIEQFLERISHCLTTGSCSILDSSEFSLVFNASLYEMAFNLIIERIPRFHHLPDESIEQLEECIGYLIQKLPQY